MGDAIARTLTRLFVTRRHLLEWVPAAQAAIGPRLDLFGFYRRMAGCVVIAAVAVLVASAWGHGTWPLALPFAALWIASPAIARWTSRSPAVAGRLSMSAWRRPGPAADRAADLAVLRDLRDAGRSTCCRRTISRRTRRRRSRIGPRRPISASISCRW